MSPLKGDAGFRYTPPGGTEKTHALAHPLTFRMVAGKRKNREEAESLDLTVREVISFGNGRREIEATIRFDRNPEDVLDMLSYGADGVHLFYYPSLSVDDGYELHVIDFGTVVNVEPDQDRFGFGEYQVRARFRDATANGRSLSALISPWLFRYTAGMAAPFATFSRASTARYVDQDRFLATAAVDELRDGHWYETSAGLLIPTTLLEEARSNDFSAPEDFSDAAWTKANASISTDAATDPEGGSTADKLVEANDTGQNHLVRQTPSALTDDTGQPLTVFAEAAERNWVALRFTDQAANANRAWFNLSTGELGSTQGTVLHREIEHIRGGIYRIKAVFDSASGGTTPQAFIELADADASPNYDGDGSSGLYLWGAQFEVDAGFPSSYTGTTSRVNDLLKFPFLAPPQILTGYLDHIVVAPPDQTDNDNIFFRIGTSGDHVRLDGQNTGVAFRAVAVSGGAGVSASNELDESVAGVGDRLELLFKYFGDGAVQLAYRVNGGAVTTGAKGAAPGLFTSFGGQEVQIGDFQQCITAAIAPGDRSMDEMATAGP